MLTRPEIDPATLAAARAVGLSPSELARRCVRRALRGALISFFRGALTPRRSRAGAATIPFCRGALTPRHEGRA